MTSFKLEHPLEQRANVAAKILTKYPDRIPVICEKAPKSNAPEIDKKKFLVPSDVVVGKFMYEIRKHIPSLSPDQSIFLFAGASSLAPNSALMSVVYAKHKDEDGFLYLTYHNDSSFGGV